MIVPPMEKAFARDLSALESIFGMISGFAAQQGIGPSVEFDLCLAIEELFVNMVKYNPGNTNEIRIGLLMSKGQVVVSLTDYGVKPFDITKAPEYDGSLPLERRGPGKLGIYFARRVMDRVTYNYSDGRSTVTLIKLLGGSDV
jgi:anti-sigma regulatory factor (Ser/Thr protein kinase)